MPTNQIHKVLTRVHRRQYRNPIHLAQQWQRAIISREYSSTAALAYYLGISRARVTQILNLLKLSPEALEIVSALGDPLVGSIITERSLSPLLAFSAEQREAQLRIILSKRR